MGIKTEFNPDLALRKRSNDRKQEECLPEPLTSGETYPFLKKGQRNYWLEGEIPLLETKGNEQLSKPIASVIILEATHFMGDGEPWTKGKYKVVEVFNDEKIRFNGFAKVD